MTLELKMISGMVESFKFEEPLLLVLNLFPMFNKERQLFKSKYLKRRNLACILRVIFCFSVGQIALP